MIRPAPDVAALPHAALGASALFQGYTARDRGATAFYRWDWGSAEDRAQAARVAADRAAHRGAVADVLAEQNRAWDAPPDVLALVDVLRQPDAVAVVTGQQLGLFAGPLYTIYKALTAVRLAEQLAAETGRPVAPVFWLADEDHDLAEVHRAVLTEGADVRTVAYDDGRSVEDNRQPVGRIVLDGGAVAATLDGLAASLPPGPGREDALRIAREAYRPGRTMRDAVALLIRRLVPGLVLLSADDARLKRLGAPLFRRELDDWQGTLDVLEARGLALAEAGFHTQVEPSPVNLFWIDDDGRRLALDPVEGGFEARGEEGRWSRDELLDRVEAEPERFSPNVVLRPLLQDTLLPTAAYVAGPGEAAYFAQLGPVYERFGVPMPVIAPRLSLTIVEPGAGKVLDRYALAIADLKGDVAALWRRLALEASAVDLDAAFADAHRAVAEAEARLAGAVPAVDTSLGLALGAAMTRMRDAIDRLETKTVRVEKRNHDTIRERLERAQAALWPGGALQERAVTPLQVVARHGLDALAGFVGALPLDPAVHHVVRP